MALVINLLGTFQVTWAERPLKFATEHSRALLAYLAVEADVIHQRSALATLLWPEENEPRARQNLRQALLFLKRTLGATAIGDGIFDITSTTLQWHSQGVVVDLHTFQQVWRRSQSHSHSSVQHCATCIQAFTQAVARYQGEFLQGLFLRGNQPFEEWALLLREQTHRQAMAMLESLTAHHLTQAAYDAVQHYAARQVTLEPWHEQAHRQLMLALAAQGQPSAALRQYESCRKILQQELGVPPAAETTKLYEQIRAGEPLRIAPPRAEEALAGRRARAMCASAVVEATKRLHNLPATGAPLVGRSEQLAQLHALISSRSERLLTIAGIGGMGKSRLALTFLAALAAESPPLFSDGVWFVPLIGVVDGAATLPDALAGATLKAIGVMTPDQTALQQALFHYVAPRNLLLLFDNFEHLLLGEESATAATAFILALLHAAPGATLLITSRLPLQLLPETIIRLEGLPVPAGPLATVDQRDAANYESIRLFVYHAQRTMPSFTLDEAKLPAVIDLCRALSGMPLAIELAAALTPHFAPHELAATIRQNLAILVSPRRDLDLRHRQFSAVLHSSWQLLSACEQQVLMQCAIFVGRFSRTAALTITGTTISTLTDLVDKSLIQQLGVGVYQLHELLRQFFTDQLQRSTQATTAVADRHSAYYLNFVATREAALARRAPRQAAIEIQGELDNIHQAWIWTATQRRQTQINQAQPPGEHCARLNACAYGLWQFYLMVGRYGEGVALFRQAIDGVQAALAEAKVETKAEEAGAQPFMERHWQQLLSKLLGLEALILCIQGQYEAALTTAQDALTVARAWGSRTGEVLGLICLTQVHYFTDQSHEAEIYAVQVLQRVQQPALAAATDEGLPSEIGYDAQILAYIYLSAIARNADDHAEAMRQIKCALTLCQSLGKLRSEMHVRTNLANLARYKQNYTAARQDYEQVLQIAGELGYRRAESMARYELADVLRGLGEYTQALLQFEHALASLQESGEPFVENYASIDIGRLYAYMGNYTQAAHLIAQALARSDHFTMPDAKLDTWLAASLLHRLTGKNVESLHYATRCHQVAQARGTRRYQGYAALYMGHALEGLARWPEAHTAYSAALELYQQLDIQPIIAEAQAGLARTTLALGDQAAAQSWVEKLLLLLDEQPTIGLDEPFQIYLTGYQILAANADPRAATILHRGAAELLRYRAQITDQTLQHTFLEAVPTHRALYAAYTDRSFNWPQPVPA